MKFFFYIIVFLITKIKNKKQKKYSIGRENEKIKKKILEIKEKGEYTIKGKYKLLNIKVNTSDIIVNFKNGEYNTKESPLILIGKNLGNIIINFYNSHIFTKNGLVIKINEYSNVKLNIIDSYFNTSRIFDLKNDYKIKIINNEEKNEDNIFINNGITYDCDINKIIKIDNINFEFKSINKISKIGFLDIVENMKNEKSSLYLYNVGISFLKTFVFFLTQKISKLSYCNNDNKLSGKSLFLFGNSSIAKFNTTLSGFG